MSDYLITPGNRLHGDIQIAGDKSISHRSVMFGALAEGKTRINGLLEGEDVLATIAAFRAMGVDIQGGSGSYTIHGVGLHGLEAPASVLDMGNSGTACRLLAGILAGQPWPATMSGDQSLNSRPMARIIDPLVEMGARIESSDGKPPLTVGFAREDHETLHGIRYAMPIASAQVKSAILLAGMYADGITRVKEPRPTRDHTERMLNGFGYVVNSDGDWIGLEGGGKLVATDITVPADLSSATFFLLAAVISGDAGLRLPGVGINPSRNGVLPLLDRMGANIFIENQRDVGGEPVADLKVASSRLRAIDIGAGDVALAVDEIPAIAVAAACAPGITRISGAGELRVKESDRIATTVAGLKALGVEVEEHTDGMTIQGGPIRGGTVDSHGDHRIAMAFAMAGNIARDPVRVRNVDCVATSFPGFDALARSAGLSLELIAAGQTND